MSFEDNGKQGTRCIMEPSEAQHLEHQFICQYYDFIQRLVKRIVWDPDMAEEIRQELLLLAVTCYRKDDSDKIRSLKAFLTTSCRYMLCQELRRKELQSNHLTRMEPEQMEALPLEGQPDGFEALLAQERNFTVDGVIAGLSQQRDRQIVKAFYYADLTVPDLTARFELTEAQVYRVLYRARQRLAGMFENDTWRDWL